MEVLASVFSTASSTLLKTGTLSFKVLIPPLPGVTPDTMFVP